MQLLFRGALPRIRAVLFDMDGLLIDSERLAQRSCLQAGRELGYPIDESVTRRLLGCTHEECERIISEALPGVDVLDYFKRSKRMLDESFHKELKAKRGKYFNLYMSQFRELDIDTQLNVYKAEQKL